MKAISTKYYGPTATRPSKVVATDSDRNRFEVACSAYDSSDEAHRAAAEGLRDMKGWKGRLIAGGTKTGQVFVFADDSPAILALKRALEEAGDGKPPEHDYLCSSQFSPDDGRSDIGLSSYECSCWIGQAKAAIG